MSSHVLHSGPTRENCQVTSDTVAPRRTTELGVHLSWGNYLNAPLDTFWPRNLESGLEQMNVRFKGH